ncbi:MAG: FAD-dependent oxidoreductase [bacterium]|nr:FAD-dependent oxidoreductase [bacterium]
MKVAVIGAGIFGITVATRLAKEGHEIDLWEKQGDILTAASGINQFRLHRGYHYPRCDSTTRSSLETEKLFKQEYPEAIISDGDHYYCIAKERSLISGETYVNFCKSFNLEFAHHNLDIINPDSVDVCLNVKEDLIDADKLKELCFAKIRESGVNLLLGMEATKKGLEDYDFVVICAYAATNKLLEDRPGLQRDYQFELCEKPVLRLPPIFNNKSVVIMDGPFTCIDPYGKTGLFVMGNVVHAIHQTNVGKYPIVEDKFKPLLNNGVIKNPSITNIKLFIEAASYFMPEIVKAEHVGSMFTFRTVLPNQDKTDSRPTLVDMIDDRIITVFSGKISNCIGAAEKVSRIINS